MWWVASLVQQSHKPVRSGWRGIGEKLMTWSACKATASASTCSVRSTHSTITAVPPRSTSLRHPIVKPQLSSALAKRSGNRRSMEAPTRRENVFTPPFTGVPSITLGDAIEARKRELWLGSAKRTSTSWMLFRGDEW